jgi:hypothetical protein
MVYPITASNSAVREGNMYLTGLCFAKINVALVVDE